MNCPAKPGQNSSGKNTASVVAVEAVIGQAMRCAAMRKASNLLWPLAISRSPSSTTTMAPSTSIPTTRISANSTITFSVKPSAQITRMPPRNEPGIATATRSEARVPRNSTVTSITSTTAAMTLFCRSDSRSRISTDWSFMKST